MRMKCNIQGCPGNYENKLITHTGKKDGKIVVILDVPAEVCDFCGDTLISKETNDSIFKLLDGKEFPVFVPALKFVA
jgi:YgiT-type zinc finger domain-containing protein